MYQRQSSFKAFQPSDCTSQYGDLAPRTLIAEEVPPARLRLGRLTGMLRARRRLASGCSGGRRRGGGAGVWSGRRLGLGRLSVPKVRRLRRRARLHVPQHVRRHLLLREYGPRQTWTYTHGKKDLCSHFFSVRVLLPHVLSWGPYQYYCPLTRTVIDRYIAVKLSPPIYARTVSHIDSRAAICGSTGSFNKLNHSTALMNHTLHVAHQAAFHQRSIGARLSRPLLKRCPDFTREPQVRGISSRGFHSDQFSAHQDFLPTRQYSCCNSSNHTHPPTFQYSFSSSPLGDRSGDRGGVRELWRDERWPAPRPRDFHSAS